MTSVLYVTGVLYGVGLSFGIVLCTLIAFHISVARSKMTFSLRDGTSLKLVWFMGLFNIAYFVVKFFQMNGINNDCGTQEALSVAFYLGSNLILYLFYVSRYIEVYGWKANVLVPVLVLILVFAAAIPVSILSNVTLIKGGTCEVYHPPISALFPSITCFIISAYMMALFLYPLFQSINFTSDARKKRLALNIFGTNFIALVSTVLFNATLSTPAGAYAPLTSSLDLMINFLMVCLPYFLVKKSSGGSASHNDKLNKETKQSQVQSAQMKSIISERSSKL